MYFRHLISSNYYTINYKISNDLFKLKIIIDKLSFHIIEINYMENIKNIKLQY